MRFPDDPYLDYGLIDEGIKYLKFRVDEQDFGVELEKIIEITEIKKLYLFQNYLHILKA